ncbi:receptor kinase-like protein Xa21 [Senna tora]|uniref:non-specific serine/threonine protein kinase n=1 Tax=Senna tora TaxID=362788 RepID=A0A834XBY0_9FABA|nr:receptor kinase-like protein Xa21 [Senna tora]
MDLTVNYLSGHISSNLFNISTLTKLKFGSNNLSGPIPPNIGSGLANLKELFLHSNQFKGKIPQSISNVSKLNRLRLDLNKFSGIIPNALGNLTNLIELRLDGNDLNGSIPATINKMQGLQILDLSNNKLKGFVIDGICEIRSLSELHLAYNMFSGLVPSMISMEFLDLSQNYLSGVIPKSLESLVHLKYINLSYNLLHGEIPSGGPFINFTAESFVMNEDLCGKPQLGVKPCKKGSRQRSTNDMLLIKCLLPIMLAVILVASCLLFLKHKGNDVNNSTNTDLLNLEMLARVSYYELLQGTNGFDECNFLGQGSFGTVYKGILSSGQMVAVKIYNIDLEEALRSFDTECIAICNLRHRNLVKIISSCTNVDFKSLIMEFMPNGSLERWLYSHNYCLDILQRLNIMIDIASALEYLHHGSSTPIVHCDVKPSNVLLDEDMIARLSDFGISKLLGEEKLQLYTSTLATVGYMAPEYGSKGVISMKGDVYSYGIMLMEVFTRKKPTDDMFVEGLSLKDWVSNSTPHSIVKVLDANLLQRDHQIVSCSVVLDSAIGVNWLFELKVAMEMQEEEVQLVWNKETDCEVSKYMLVGKILAENVLNRKAVISMIKKGWNLHDGFSISEAERVQNEMGGEGSMYGPGLGVSPAKEIKGAICIMKKEYKELFMNKVENKEFRGVRDEEMKENDDGRGKDVNWKFCVQDKLKKRVEDQWKDVKLCREEGGSDLRKAKSGEEEELAENLKKVVIKRKEDEVKCNAEVRRVKREVYVLEKEMFAEGKDDLTASEKKRRKKMSKMVFESIQLIEVPITKGVWDGLGVALIVKELKRLCREYKPSIVFLMETRMKENKMEKVKRKCCNLQNNFYVDVVGKSKGLALCALTKQENLEVWNKLRRLKLGDDMAWFCLGDHCPLIIDLKYKLQKVRKSFKFDAMWVDHKDCSEVVEDGWKWEKRDGQLSEESRGDISDILKRIEELWDLEEKYWHQGSRVKWLQAGDKNSRFFHQSTIQSRQSNKVLRLKGSVGNWIEDEDCIVIDEDVPMEEVKKAAFELGASKAPGLDGFFGKFYHASWEIVWEQVINSVLEFFNGRMVGDFKPGRGLKQGEPLSPCLFILVADVLYSMLNNAASDGLPTLWETSKVVALAFVKDKFLNKIQGWKKRILSQAGREILIKAVASFAPSSPMGF